MTNGYRQEVFNVLLAQLLQERGVIAAPEEVLRATPEKHRRIPDVIMNFSGLRTVLEGEVNDQPNAEIHALESARRRVEEGIAHIGIAVVYPARLRKISFKNLKSKLENSQFKMAIVTESGETGFSEVNINSLSDALKNTFDHLVKEDVVAHAVAAIDAGIERFAGVVSKNPGTVDRLAEVLGIRELPNHKIENETE